MVHSPSHSIESWLVFVGIPHSWSMIHSPQDMKGSIILYNHQPTEVLNTAQVSMRVDMSRTVAGTVLLTFPHLLWKRILTDPAGRLASPSSALRVANHQQRSKSCCYLTIISDWCIVVSMGNTLETYPPVNWHNYAKSHFSMGKSTISMGHFQ